MFQDPKYFILAINRQTGRQIPPHVPLMLFNARDRVALSCAITPYVEGCEMNGASAEQIASARERATAFAEFSEDHPDEMKIPGASNGAPADTPAFPVAIDQNYTYWLSGGNVVQFEKPAAEGVLHAGTTNEEVLSMLIDRIQQQHAKHPSSENEDILAHLGQARAIQADRMKRMEGVISSLMDAGAAIQAEMKGETLFGIFMHPCTSSNIKAFGYRADTKVLALQFTRSNAVYHYRNVPEQVYNGLIEADSVGSYAAQHITGQFEGERQQEPAQATA